MKPRGRRVDPAQKKARRQKLIVVVGAVLLAAIGAFEVPKVLNHGKRHAVSSQAPASTTTASETESSAASGTASTPSASPAAVVTPSPGPVRLPSQSEPTASEGQLVSFSLLRSKDPFKQQLGGGSSTTPSSPPTAKTPVARTRATVPPTSTSGSGETPPVSTSTVPVTSTEPEPPETAPTTETEPETPPAQTTPSTSEPPTTTTEPPTTTTEPPTTTTEPPAPAPAPKPTSAKISVNGVAESVAVGDSFPKAQPLFRLVSIKDDAVRIGIAGGTLEGSSQTVALVKGKSLTLMNTADGMRYVLRLVSIP
jgi:hypothetical protein